MERQRQRLNSLIGFMRTMQPVGKTVVISLYYNLAIEDLCFFYICTQGKGMTSTKSYLFRSHSTVKSVISVFFSAINSKSEDAALQYWYIVMSLGKSAKPHIMTGSAYMWRGPFTHYRIYTHVNLPQNTRMPHMSSDALLMTGL